MVQSRIKEPRRMTNDQVEALFEFIAGLHIMIVGLKFLQDPEAKEMMDALENAISAIERFLLSKGGQRDAN